MAVTFQNSARYVSAEGVSSYSPTHNLLTGSGNQRIVVVCVNWEDSGVDTISSITLGGNAPDGSLGVVAGTGYSAYAYLAWWYDTNLPASTGNTTIAVTPTGSITREIMVHVMEFTGVDQSATVNTNTGSSTSAGTVNCSVSISADNSLAVNTFTAGGTTFGSPVDANITVRQSGAVNSSAGGIGSYEDADGSSIDLGWQTLSTRGAVVGAVFEEYVASSSSSSSSVSSSSSSSTSSSSSSSSISSSSSSSSVSSSSSSSQIPVRCAKVIAQDTNGTFDTNVTSWTDVPFNNTVDEDSALIVEHTSNTTIQVKESGHYLVLYNIVSRNDTYNNRVEFMSRIEVNGSGQSEGRGQGYRRNTSNDRVFMQASAILDLSANDNITIGVIRTSTNDPTTHLLEANRSSFQVLRLDDDWEYFRAVSTDTTDVDGSTWHAVTWNTVNESDSSFTHTGGNANVGLDAGTYLITYNVRANTGALSTRKTITTKATLDNVDQPYGWGYSYMRGLNGCNDGAASAMFLLETSGEDLQIEVSTILDLASATINLVSNESALTIWKLPPSANVLMAHSNNAQACETPAIIVHETEDVEDSAFTHDTGTGRVTLNEDGSYLFGWTSGVENPNYAGTPTTTRGTFGTQWNINASGQAYGIGGHFIRNAAGPTGIFRGGHMATSLFSGLSTNDIIDIRATLEGDNGGAEDEYKADEHGLWGIYLDDTCYSSSSSSTSSSSSSVSSSSSLSSTSSSSSATPGTITWGHQTDIQEDYKDTFEGNWFGGSEIDGTNNNEVMIYTCPPETDISKAWYLGTGRATIRHNKYQVGFGNVTKFYRTATTREGLRFKSFDTFDTEFISLGWVQIQVSNQLD